MSVSYTKDYSSEQGVHMNSQMKVYKARLGRIPCAEASVAMELGWPPSLHVDVFTNPEAPLVSLFQSFYQSLLSRHGWLSHWPSMTKLNLQSVELNLNSPGQGSGLKVPTL